VIRPAEAFRVIHIAWVLLRHGLDEFILAAHLFRPIRFFRFLSPFYWLSRGERPPYAVRIRRTLEDLGPIFVKFGQILSTRRDLLPDDIAEELAKLQDSVPPFPGAQARAIVEAAYGRPVTEVFAAFEEQPLASASIAQVHAARLRSGQEVVVKVLRPGVAKVIRRDIDLLYTIARLAQRYSKEARRLRPVEVVQEYEKTIFDELDLLREAANCSQLRRNFLGSEMLYVPEVHWDYCRPEVMVTERIYGTPVDEADRLRAQGISMKLLGERGVEIFFTQVFRDNFFHADMHPGNIFVAPDGRYIGVDFGIMGTLTSEDQRYLAENLLAFFHRDYRRVAELHAYRRVRVGDPHGLRADLGKTALRDLLRPLPAAVVPGGAPLRHGGAAAARAAAEDPAEHRGPGPDAVSAARPVEHRQAVHGALDAGAGGAEGLPAARADGAAGMVGGRAGDAAARLSRAQRRGRGAPHGQLALRRARGAAPRPEGAQPPQRRRHRRRGGAARGRADRDARAAAAGQRGARRRPARSRRAATAARGLAVGQVTCGIRNGARGAPYGAFV